MIVRIDSDKISQTALVEQLERVAGPTKAWLHNRIAGEHWTVERRFNADEWGEPLGSYHKVWLREAKLATALLLTI